MADFSMERKRIQVQIFGMEYSLKSDMDEEYVKQVADYVDSKIKQFAENNRVKSQTKIAVLAALNIADELFRLKEKYVDLLKSVESQSKDTITQVDQVLKDLTNS